jgi:hypothetical protein
LCVGSHIVFTTTPRAELPPSMDGHADLLLSSAVASLNVTSEEGVRCGSMLTARTRRSTLCVYRI